MNLHLATYRQMPQLANDNVIVGICGAKQSGKTTAAQIIANKYKFNIINFADKLKSVCYIITGMDYWSEHTKEIEHLIWKESPRTILQYIGTELFRDHFNEDIWITALHYGLLNSSVYPRRYVIGDVRFQNEVTYLNKIGATLIVLDRGEFTLQPDSHRSEQISSLDFSAFSEGVHYVNNNGNLSQLANQLDTIIQTLNLR
jgi:hypothetical protein